MATDQGIIRRRDILRMQQERVCHRHRVAIGSGTMHPVIWLVDQDDPAGQDICLFALGMERLLIDRQRVRAPAGAMVLRIFVWTISDSLRLLSDLPDGDASLLLSPRSALDVDVAIVAGGGTTVARIEQPA